MGKSNAKIPIKTSVAIKNSNDKNHLLLVLSYMVWLSELVHIDCLEHYLTHENTQTYSSIY